jgi:hypothetical protein
MDNMGANYAVWRHSIETKCLHSFSSFHAVMKATLVDAACPESFGNGGAWYKLTLSPHQAPSKFVPALSNEKK